MKASSKIQWHQKQNPCRRKHADLGVEEWLLERWGCRRWFVNDEGCHFTVDYDKDIMLCFILMNLGWSFASCPFLINFAIELNLLLSSHSFATLIFSYDSLCDSLIMFSLRFFFPRNFQFLFEKCSIRYMDRNPQSVELIACTS